MMEIPRNFFSVDDLIRALGLQGRRRVDQGTLPSVALFGAGLLVGAGLALLLTPITGAELREEIGDRVRTGGSGESENGAGDERVV